MTVATVFVWLAFLCPIASLALPRALAPLMAAGAVAVAILLWREKRMPPLAVAPAALLGALVAWGLVTLFWSLEPARGLVTAGKLGFLFAGGLLLAGAAATLGPDDRRRIGTALCIGAFAALALLGEEMLTGGALSRPVRGAAGAARYEPFQFNAATTVLAVLIWPALIALRTRWGTRACAAGLAAGLAVLTTTESTTGAIAAAVGALAAGWGLFGRSCAPVRRIAAGCVIAALVAVPAYSVGVKTVDEGKVPSYTVSSMLHRLHIWDFAAAKIREKPVFGWGLEASRSIPGGHAPRPPPAGRTVAESIADSYRAQLMPLHPHNAGLQVWLELGVPGILLFGGFLVWLLRAMGRRALPGPLPCLCLAQFASAFTIAELSYGAWQSWWVAALALACALTIAVLPAEAESPGSG